MNGALKLEARLVDDADRRAEPHDQRLLAFVDDIDRGGDEIDGERGEAECDGDSAAAHFAAPGAGGAARAGPDGFISDIGR